MCITEEVVYKCGKVRKGERRDCPEMTKKRKSILSIKKTPHCDYETPDEQPICCTTECCAEQIAQAYMWRGWRQSSVTLTYDDRMDENHKYVIDIHDKKLAPATIAEIVKFHREKCKISEEKADAARKRGQQAAKDAVEERDKSKKQFTGNP